MEGQTIMIPLHEDAIEVQPVPAPWLAEKQIILDVLRIDKIHPVISGNKWFKLRYYLHEAKQQSKLTIATFGGAWSNHIAATAFACKAAGFHSVGFIRGEAPATPSQTLIQAKADGMQLIFLPREMYRNKPLVMQQYANNDWHWVPEGGYGQAGAEGAATILDHVSHLEKYTHIIAAVGTGTMTAGLLKAALSHQVVIGISSMKGNYALHDAIMQLAPGAVARLQVLHNYHFGGYAKINDDLIAFMNEIFLEHQLPLDRIYTAKTLYALKDLVEKNYFAPGSRLLMIHSGGLQGNNSISPQVLAF